MKFILKLLLPFFKKFIVAELTKESNKTFVVNELNKYIDLPNMSEEDERQVLENVYNALGKLLESVLVVKED